MGTGQSKPPLPSQLQHRKDSRYGGNIMIDINQTKVYQIFDIDQNNVDTFSNLLKTRKQLQHSNFITINRTWIDDYRQQCSLQKMYRITVQYKYLSMNLQDQIKKYCIKRIPVPQQLIRKYFYQIVLCLEYLKNKGTCHGDIKPKNILINNKNNNAYLLDSYFINGGRVAFQIVLQDPQSLSLLSPGQLESLKNKKFISLKQVHDDQMFGIGLSMMQAMTAQPAMECYDLANLRMKPDYFHKKYSQMLSCSYSPQLCQLVMSCVQFNPIKRIKFPQFLQIINMGIRNY